jgi:hypothetical protein
MIALWKKRQGPGGSGHVQQRQMLDKISQNVPVFLGVRYRRNERNGSQDFAAVGLVTIESIGMTIENLSDPGRARARHAAEQDYGVFHGRDHEPRPSTDD